MHRYQLLFTLWLVWTCSQLWFPAVLMFWGCLVHMKQMAGCVRTRARTHRCYNRCYSQSCASECGRRGDLLWGFTMKFPLRGCWKKQTLTRCIGWKRWSKISSDEDRLLRWRVIGNRSTRSKGEGGIHDMSAQIADKDLRVISQEEDEGLQNMLYFTFSWQTSKN